LLGVNLRILPVVRPCLASYVLLIASFAQATLAQQPEQRSSNDPLWKAVHDAMNEGLPQTAIEKLEPIIRRATDAQDYPEAIKAIATKIDLQASIQADQPDLKIRSLRAEIDAAPAEMQPVMKAILANWMWQFFQQHRWQFTMRTQVSQSDDPDMLTWDLARILREIDAQFTQSLSDAEHLRSTPTKDYAVLLDLGTAPEDYRPTMYDILAHHALEFYSAGEQAVTLAIGAFELSAGSPIFASTGDFLAWEPQSTDERSALLRAARLYQELLRFHQDDESASARLDVDLLRLEFGNSHAVGEEKTSRYQAALQRFEAANASHPISTRALYNLATIAHEKGQWAEAHQIASRALARFPDSIGGKLSYNLIQQIEAKEANITTERVWNDPWPTIDVRYRNVNKVFLRLVRFDFDDFTASRRWQPEQLDEQQHRRLLAQQPLKAWSADLPATDDYQWKSHSLPVPQDIAPGSYFLLASHREDFREADNQLSMTEVWVSKLAIVFRNQQNSGLIGGFVLDAKSGEPIAGATVRAWQQDNRGQLSPLAPISTDQDGKFEFPPQNRNRLLLLVVHGDQRLSSASYLSSHIHPHREQTLAQTQFFTDRAIYRPGQTIRYKGISLSAQWEHDRYRTLNRVPVTVSFVDANGKEIERLQHQTNDYGSFSGSVTAPRDRVTGQMFLRIEAGPPGQTSIRVEEYKRPRFAVELAAPEQAAKLGGEVSLTGTATAYTGAAVDGSAVSWRVVREVRFPPWWHWYGGFTGRGWWPPMQGDRQEIARGTATTDDRGTFKISFIAKPDASVPAESEPTFRYTIHADVTDSAGETRSAEKAVNLGYTALTASLKADQWLTTAEPFELEIRTTTLDGDGQAAEGMIHIHSLKEPAEVKRPSLSGEPIFRGQSGISPPKPDPSDPNAWELDEVVFEADLKTDGAGNQKLSITLPAGTYRAVLKTRDRFGKEVTALLPLDVIDLEAAKLTIKVPHRVQSEQTSLQPGETFRAVWGSGYDTARAFIEVEHRGQVIKSYWTPKDRTQVMIDQEVTESMRGGFTLHTTTVRENRAYLHSQQIDVPWKNKELSIKWERFVSKLQPAQTETWTAVISGPDAERVAAEMVATLYDASLDAFQPHTWISGFGVFRQEHSRWFRGFENQLKHLSVFRHGWSIDYRDAPLTYPRIQLPSDERMQAFGNLPQTRGMRGKAGGRMGMMRGEAMMAEAAPMAAMADGAVMNLSVDSAMAMGESAKATGEGGDAAAGASQLDLDSISARKNLEETAFFFPHAIAGDDGTVRLEFTMPEALTKWKFFGFAHDSELRGGLLSDSVVTSKDLMIQPNAPRFLREGDQIEFTVKVTNQSPTRQSGSVRLTLADARSGDSVDDALGNTAGEQSFDLPSGQSQSVAWRLSVPDGLTLLSYRAVGSSGRLSDGEEGYLPIIPRRVLITESLPLPIRGQQTKNFDFTRLAQAADSESLKHQSLTVQMASNPTWYAVMALPYLMESPHPSSEQIFNRLYSNALARHIAASDPRIERIFAQWRGTPALDSPLNKNEDLKALMIEETPWYRQAESESQSRRNVGILFDNNRLNDETARALNQLAQQQLDDGRWPWFPGGGGNDYITLYITTGFGRLRHLGVAVDTSPAIQSLTRLDAWMADIHRRVTENKDFKKEANHLSPLIAMYLYGRSFFLQDLPLAPEHAPALQFWLDQSRQHWLKLNYIQSQAHLAIALKRFGDAETARRIMASLKERAVNNEEMGMHWPGRQRMGWWYHAPIETQAMAIEAFDEVVGDTAAVEDCKAWLLKQKQTQDWKTTKATADAVYALLLRGTDQLASTKLVEVTLGETVIHPEATEAGTGFYEQRFIGNEVDEQFSQITVAKSDEGVAWGSVHWQYFEDIANVTAYAETPLKLTKELYVKRNTDYGPQLNRIDGPVEVGDELVVRLVLRTDRDLEYVHLKDHRGSGTEPVDVLSNYRFREGLAYYQSTRDTASHFFIDYLRQGTYVFEYSTRVQLRGEYQTGMASIQCMYAPEFGGHSESLLIKVGGK
jgi:uncharacterized protein YfaS (alpha-2-macroglobulin family)/tetratricopeptide (TPR) repeat protein